MTGFGRLLFIKDKYNLRFLRRNGRQDGGSFGIVDDLYYEYDGNRLCKVSNAVESPCYKGAMHFADGSDEDTEYGYDADGNLIEDKNKDITRITYNVLNLPEHLDFKSGKYVNFTYSSTGKKLRSDYLLKLPELHTPDIQSVSSDIFDLGKDPGGIGFPIDPGLRDSMMFRPDTIFTDEQYAMIYGAHRIDYCSDIIYENLKPMPNRILFDGGYVTFTNNKQPVYHFYLTDHQGNVRVVADENGTIEETNHYYPFGALFGESVDKNKQRYKYNGKELDRLLSLDWYDYGARWYDPVLARWHSVDPLAEKYPDVSPYVYCHDNPVNKVDPDGMDDYFNESGDFLFNKGQGGNIYIRRANNFINFSDIDLRNAKNLQMAACIVGYYAKSVGIEYNKNGGIGDVGISTLHKTDGMGRVLAGTINGNIYIKMTHGHLDEYMYDSYQLRGTLRHENEHKKMQDKGKGNANNLQHAQIILTEIQGPEFKSCSREYQEAQIDKFRDYLRQAERKKDNSETIRDLYKMISVIERRL